VYVSSGEIELAGERVTATRLAVLTPGVTVALRARTSARLMLLGGERFATPRHIWWNFVSSSEARIEQAKRDWADGRFAAVPGETERIPLPDT
jgi:hypothetical protein